MNTQPLTPKLRNSGGPSGLTPKAPCFVSEFPDTFSQSAAYRTLIGFRVGVYRGLGFGFLG